MERSTLFHGKTHYFNGHGFQFANCWHNQRVVFLNLPGLPFRPTFKLLEDPPWLMNFLGVPWSSHGFASIIDIDCHQSCPIFTMVFIGFVHVPRFPCSDIGFSMIFPWIFHWNIFPMDFPMDFPTFHMDFPVKIGPIKARSPAPGHHHRALHEDVAPPGQPRDCAHAGLLHVPWATSWAPGLVGGHGVWWDFWWSFFYWDGWFSDVFSG